MSQNTNGADYKPARVFVDQKVADLVFTREFLGRLPGVPVEFIQDPVALVERASMDADPFAAGKETVLLAHYDGAFFKPCPGATRGALCCDYYVINLVSGCNYDCSFCFLQEYLYKNPLITIYANRGDLLSELNQRLDEAPFRHFRVGTGELADSLSLDHLTRHAELLVPFFARRTNAIFELKTKSTMIDHLLDLDHNGRTVIAWSLNSEEMAEREEKGAPSIHDRLAAAGRCRDAGYKVGFHFDPIIHYPGWEDGYRRAVELIFEYMDPGHVAWISLGAFRCPTGLEAVIRERHPNSVVYLGEVVRGKDGKVHYVRPLRTDMFTKMAAWLREKDPGVPVYLCMEAPEIWADAMGSHPRGSAELSDLIVSRCGARVPA